MLGACLSTLRLLERILRRQMRRLGLTRKDRLLHLGTEWEVHAVRDAKP